MWPCRRLQCALLLLVSLALVLSTAAAAPAADPRLRQFLQKSLAAAAGKQELAKLYYLAELFSESSLPENEALEPNGQSRSGEQNEVRLEVERSANMNPALAPRGGRKARCNEFFWKTFRPC